MALTDEEITKILIKDISAKTILVDSKERDATIKNYLDDGWELVKQSPLGDRFKLTFKKVK